MTNEKQMTDGPGVILTAEDDSRLRRVLELCKEIGVSPVIVVSGIVVNGNNNTTAGRDLVLAGNTKTI